MNKMSKSNYIPTYKDEIGFEPVKNPELNFYYHLSWAYKGAKFCLTKINDDGTGEVYTGKTNNKTIKIKLADLRHIRFRKNKF
jgi:hypothetical protein